MLVLAEFLIGCGSGHAAMDRALAMEDRISAGQLLLRPTSMAGGWPFTKGGSRRPVLGCASSAVWATERGEESELPFPSARHQLVWWRSDFAAAERYAEEACSLSVQTGSETMPQFALVHRARARAARRRRRGAGGYR